MAYQRFTDREDLPRIMRECGDFNCRYSPFTAGNIMYVFVASLVVLIALIGYLGMRLTHLSERETISEGALIQYGVLIFIFICGISLFTYFFAKKIRERIFLIEFQNMLFAGGMVGDSEFCMLIKGDLTPIYHDEAFAEIFHHDEAMPPDNLQLLLDHPGGFSVADKQSFLQAIKHGKPEVVSFVLSTKSKTKPVPLNLVVEPLRRPKGFLVIRAYKS